MGQELGVRPATWTNAVRCFEVILASAQTASTPRDFVRPNATNHDTSERKLLTPMTMRHRVRTAMRMSSTGLRRVRPIVCQNTRPRVGRVSLK